MNHINHIIHKIVDLIPLNDKDIEYIRNLSDHDKMIVIIRYHETMIHLIYFLENFI